MIAAFLMTENRPVTPILRLRALLLMTMLAFALGLAGCGNKEAAQRTAFIEFLQTRVLDKPGVRVPKPTDEQKAAFGDYASHYAVIVDFNQGMSQSVSQPMSGIVQRGALSSIADLVARRDDLKLAQEGIGALRAALDQHLAKADAAHAALKQPEDLKAVYDKAYDRTVTQPATAFKEVFPALDAVFSGALKTADYIQQNQSKIVASGTQMQVSDPVVQAQLARMLDELNRNGAAINEAQRKIEEVSLTFRNDAGRELSETVSKLNGLAEGSVALSDRVK